MAKILAQGSIFTIDDAEGNPVVIDCISSFSGMTGEAADIDVTCLSSEAREFRQGLQDFGDFTIELMRDPQQVGQIELEAAKNAQATRTFILTLPSGDVATFEGYVKSLTLEGDTDAVLTGTANIKISGLVTWS
jgi:hypothetical protein